MPRGRTGLSPDDHRSLAAGREMQARSHIPQHVVALIMQ